MSTEIPGYSLLGEFPEWYQQAACQGQDDLFMVADENSNPMRGGGRKKLIEEAKAICATCPVIDPCREIALHIGDFGVWGGMSPAELRGNNGRT